MDVCAHANLDAGRYGHVPDLAEITYAAYECILEEVAHKGVLPKRIGKFVSDICLQSASVGVVGGRGEQGRGKGTAGGVVKRTADRDGTEGS